MRQMQKLVACARFTSVIGLVVAAAGQAAVDSATASRIESALDVIVAEHAIVGLQVAKRLRAIPRSWRGRSIAATRLPD